MNEEVEKGEVDVFDRKVEREDTLVGKLLSRGLVVSDELQLRKIIRLVGYYRLTGYLYPFRQEGGEGYVKGTTLEQIWRLYTFDRRLRGCVMDALSRIEVAVRVSVLFSHSTIFSFHHPTISILSHSHISFSPPKPLSEIRPPQPTGNLLYY